MHANNRRLWAVLAVASLAMFSFSGSQAGDGGRGPQRPADVGRLIVHEWGTFTNFSGSNGIQLDFRPLLDSDLPEFVYDRSMQSSSIFAKSFYVARQRMETPVTYFYTDRARDVDVRVDFPKGLLTEFFPPVQKMTPVFDRTRPAKLENSSLDWGRIRLLPQAEFDALKFIGGDGKPWHPTIPAVQGENHYAFARETDSAVVAATSPNHGTHYEKFLFYRGLGSFSLPLELRALGDGQFRVSNAGGEAIRSLFLVHVEQGRIYFSYASELRAGSTLQLEQSSVASTIPQLGEAVVSALKETGLYEKEARAMVKTWQTSWFGEEGTRLFYLLPEKLTDELLPLSISPAPDEVVRVLVGRMEVLTPERGTRIRTALATMGTCVTLAAEPLQGELARLGRFAEPALESLVQGETDPQMRSQLKALRDELQQVRLARLLK